MTEKEIEKRQIYFRNGKNSEINTVRIITVVYASDKDVFLYDVTGLTEDEISDLVQSLIVIIQLGTNFSRDVIKRVGDTFFVY